MLPTDHLDIELDATSEDDAIRLLIVEDNDEDAYLLNTRLQRAYPGVFKTQVVRTVQSAIAVLSTVEFDAVILDQNLPDGLGVTSIAEFREITDRIPVVMLTGVADDMLELEALVRGAQDFLPKDEATGPAVRRAVLHAIERERLQKQLDASRDEAMRAQQQVFAHISHELRSPVAAMYHSATNLADGLLGKVTPAQEEAAQIIVSGAKSLRRIVNDLLDTARIAEGTLVVEPSRVNIHAAVREIVDGQRTRWNDRPVDLSQLQRVDLPAVFADPVRLRQVLSNVLSNAMVHAPGANVAIEGHWDPSTAGHVLISVRDDGPGIPPYLLERVFERSFQVDSDAPSGLGLGLYICRDLVERMGGRIWAEKNGHKGAVFHLRMPVHPIDQVLMPVLGHRRNQPDVAAVVTIEFPDDYAARTIAEAATTIAATFPDSVVLDAGEIVSETTVVALLPVERRALDGLHANLARVLGFGRSAKHQPTMSIQSIRIPAAKRKGLHERLDKVITNVLAELPPALAHHLGAEVT